MSVLTDVAGDGSPLLQTGQQVYDAIMAKIEPELVSTSLPTLDAKYAGETPEQSAARKQRYETAFANYDKKFAQYTIELQAYTHKLQSDVIAQMEGESKKEEATFFDNFDSSVAAAS